MRRERFTLGSTRHRVPTRGDPPEVMMGALGITGSWVGGLLAIGLGIYLWLAVPAFSLFLVGALALWLKQR
jgi:hypothetical protein